MKKTLLAGLLTGAALLAAPAVFAQQGTAPAAFNPPPLFSPDARADALYGQDVSTYRNEAPYAPAPWPLINERDLRWSKRVWSLLSLSDSANAVLNTGGDGFVALLLQGALSGRYSAYSGADDRFTQTLTREQLQQALQTDGGAAVLDPASVTKLLVKQDWMYVESEHRLVARIIGIAPVLGGGPEKGRPAERPLFWIYYPAARPYLATLQLTGADGRPAGTADRLLEEQRFRAQTVKLSASGVPAAGAPAPFQHR